MTWMYNGEKFTEDNVKDYVGFVYLITNLDTNKKYIGRKLFSKAGYKQVNGKRKKIRKPSDWQNYYGSNEILKEEVSKSSEEKYKREILYLCNTKSECAYYETKEIFQRDALIRNDYFNDWCSCRIRRAHLKTLLDTTIL